MTDANTVLLLKALADASRLQILRSLAEEDMYVERLAERLALKPPTVSFHLKKLSEAGVVESYKTQYYTMYRLKRQTLQQTLRDIVLAESEQQQLLQKRDGQYR
ncbi:MAG: winged helix-turn-helix transcriptional regulator, partial [Oscillospiraceae bacterium]|nr:winged helix-turn-helix transcriptional regulator [Oscillospiraceae bacterium]